MTTFLKSSGYNVKKGKPQHILTVCGKCASQLFYLFPISDLLLFCLGKIFDHEDVQFLPISGLMGTNMKSRMDKSQCPWWDGTCLFEALDAIEVPPRDPKGPFR